MDTDSLRAFVAVAETGSFSKAALQLHLTQPAISKRIHNLEAQLTAPLFDRIAKLNTLTPAGAELLPRAKYILLQLQDAQQTIANLSGTVRGHLALATTHHIGLWRLPPLLRNFTESYRDVALDLHFMDSIDAEQSILTGQVELAIVTLPANPDSRLTAIPLWEDHLEIVVATAHPLAESAACTLAELARYPAILPDLTTFTGRIINELFTRHRLDLTISMTTNYLETIKMLIAIGLGWSVLPATMLDDSIRVVKVLDEKISRELGCLHHRQRSLSNAAMAFLRVIEEAQETRGI